MKKKISLISIILQTIALIMSFLPMVYTCCAKEVQKDGGGIYLTIDKMGESYFCGSQSMLTHDTLILVISYGTLLCLVLGCVVGYLYYFNNKFKNVTMAHFFPVLSTILIIIETIVGGMYPSKGLMRKGMIVNVIEPNWLFYIFVATVAIAAVLNITVVFNKNINE